MTGVTYLDSVAHCTRVGCHSPCSTALQEEEEGTRTHLCECKEDILMNTTNQAELFQPGCVLKICAPMVRYSKLAFRMLVRKYDCDLCFTPMIIAADFVRSVKARDSEFTTSKADRPLIVQFAAKDPLILANAATIVAPFANGIDLNCGCPQRWAVSDGYGACLINNPELVRDMVRQVRNQVCIPEFSTSIKIRSLKMTLQWTAVATFLYIEIGILLFLCLPFISAMRMLRRVVTLITLLANTQETRHVLKTQAEMSEEAIKKYKEENEYLRKVNTTVLSTLKKSTADSEVIRKETDNITREYDRLLVEYAKLQWRSRQDTLASFAEDLKQKFLWETNPEQTTESGITTASPEPKKPSPKWEKRRASKATTPAECRDAMAGASGGVKERLYKSGETSRKQRSL
ncbi:DUS4L synthase, partial [Polypterus senegalus]